MTAAFRDAGLQAVPSSYLHFIFSIINYYHLNKLESTIN